MHNEKEFEKLSFNVWKKLFSLLKQLKGKIVVLIIFAIIIAFLDAVMNILNVYVIDNFIENNNYTHLNKYIIINVFYGVVFGLVVWAFIRQGSIIEAHVNYLLRKESFKNLQQLSFDYFDKTPQGYIMARMTSDARRLSNIISWTLLDLVWSILFMIFTLTILFIYSVKLAFIVLASLPLMFLVAVLFRKKILKRYRLSRKYNSEATRKYSEAFLGAKTTKTLVIEEDNLKEFDEVTNKLKRSSVRAISLTAVFSSLLLFLTYIILGLIMYNGSLLVINDVIKISTLFLFIRATTNFFDPVIMLTEIMSNIQQAQASAERIVSLIEEKPSITDSLEVIDKYGDVFNPKTDNYVDIIGDVEFRDVTFSYKDDEIILDNFNLEIKAGTKVALVGHTGSGKTTIVNLLARFYEPNSGNILIDDVDYKDFSLNYLHSQIGYVLQTPHLFSQTILENIKYGKLDATLDEVIEVCKIVGIDEFIESLPDKYDTFVGEGGNLLSLGQKQLISYARALIRDPKIMLLDEATSSVDSISENLITKATKELLKNRTSIVVAHRLSTITDSDLIIVLDEGKVVEMGSHNELLKLNGKYYDYYKSEFFKSDVK